MRDNRKPQSRWAGWLGSITGALTVVLLSCIMVVALAIILVILVNFLGDLLESV